MKIGVLGTGMVGEVLAGRLIALGHQVMLASRSPGNEKAVAWADSNGAHAHHGTFADAAAFGEIVIFAVLGTAVVDVARLAGPDAFAGKVVVDVTNPLVYVPGEMPRLDPSFINTTSAGEQLQQALPAARVVKTLNTMNCAVMVNPALAGDNHDVFLCGEDAAAKATVIDLLHAFGWAAPIDLGGIEAARGTEMMMPMWLRLYRHFGSAAFNYRIVAPAASP